MGGGGVLIGEKNAKYIHKRKTGNKILRKLIYKQKQHGLTTTQLAG